MRSLVLRSLAAVGATLVATLVAVWLPAALLALHDPWSAAVGVPDLGLACLALIALGRPSEAPHPALRAALVATWCAYALFGVAWTASLVATDERLPLYDLLLLADPLTVFAADLYGPLAPSALGLAALTVAAALVTSAAVAWTRLGRLDDPYERGTAAVLASLSLVGGLATSGPWAPAILSDLAQSIALHQQLETDLASRADLASRTLASRPDVRFYVIESYGAVLLDPPIADTHRADLRALERALRDGGWSLASGRATSPTHGGRSWLADATVLTGLNVDRQATFGHVTARGTAIPSLPRFFAERGYTTVLARPKDRNRPGIRLVNHFGFQTTVFHDDLAYTGPAVGWGHIPDQYTVDVTEQRFLQPIAGPRFAFVHLATSHYPWGETPPLLERAEDWLDAEGSRDFTVGERRPLFALRMTLSRFRARRRAQQDRYGSDLAAYQSLVVYDLRVLTRAFAAPERPTLMLWLGDHQPPFLADGRPSEAVVHVLATDPRWLDGFLADGFRDGLDPGPPREPSLHFRDLFDRITAALGDRARPDAPP